MAQFTYPQLAPSVNLLDIVILNNSMTQSHNFTAGQSNPQPRPLNWSMERLEQFKANTANNTNILIIFYGEESSSKLGVSF